MKLFKILITGLLLGAVVVSAFGCKSSNNTATATSQTYTVARGDISVEITAAGNLELSTVQDLTFDLFYAKGTVGSVNVAAGDSVTEGEVLASLDASEWNDQIQVLEDALTAARRDVTTRERALATAQRQVTTLTRQVTVKEDAVTTAERQITAKELAVQQAQIDVTSANNTLNKITPIKNLQDRINNLESVIATATSILSGEFAGAITSVTPTYWLTLRNQAEAALAQAQQDMKDILNNNNLPTSDEVAIQIAQAQLQVKTKQMALEDAQRAIANAQTAVDDANTAVANAIQDLAFAQQDMANAQADLNISNQKADNVQDSLSEAQTSSPEIIAPFDGFITRVTVAGGDEILSGTVAIVIADPNKFETEILVSEMDILSVTLGATGTVAADAVSDANFPVKVTHISPTATISSSVVNYPVTVELTSLVPVTATTTTTGLPTSGNFTLPEGMTPPEGFTLPEGFTPPTDFAPSGNFTLPEGFTPRKDRGDLPIQGSSSTTATSTNTTAATKEYTLKAGMTVTVTLTIPLSANVLLVPSTVIKTQGNQSYVTVMLDDGTTESRAITTGNTDYTSTEVTSGLSEGEKVVFSTGTTIKSTATSTIQQNQQGGIFFESNGPPGR